MFIIKHNGTSQRLHCNVSTSVDYMNKGYSLNKMLQISNQILQKTPSEMFFWYYGHT
jgi:hypothetical protein